MWNLANIITVIRILLVPTFLVALYSHSVWSNLLATIFFTIAASTDFLDGYVARKYGMVTNLGKIMDPVADKILVAAALIALVEIGRIPGWIAIVMLFRDFGVGALRDVAAQQGTVIAAGIWGKIKTAIQMVAIGFLLFYNPLVISYGNGFSLSVPAVAWDAFSGVSGIIAVPTYFIGMVLIYLALVASVYSGIVYFRQYYQLLVK